MQPPPTDTQRRTSRPRVTLWLAAEGLSLTDGGIGRWQDLQQMWPHWWKVTGTPASSLSALSFLPSRRRAALSCHHAPHHGALPLQRLEVMGLSDLNGKIWKCSSLEADLRHFVTMIEAGDDGKQWILSLPAPVGMI